MSELRLSFAFAEYSRTRPLLSGAIKPEGIDLLCTRAAMSELAWRQLGFQEFDVSELSLSSLMIARSKGDETWRAIPVFASRRFHHIRTLVRVDAGIDEPSALTGKRIGIPEYQQTAALWARGYLKHEHGVDPRTIHWFMERLPERSHGGVTGFEAPEGIDLSYIPAESSIGEMLQSGSLDATLLYVSGGDLIDRSTAVFGPGSGVRPLFADSRRECTAYFSSSGLLPINHTVVVRQSLAEREPWVVRALFEAFIEARERARAASHEELGRLVDAGDLRHPVAAAFARDPFPYGIEDNAHVLETAFAYSEEQGLTGRRLAVEDLFYPEALYR